MSSLSTYPTDTKTPLIWWFLVAAILAGSIGGIYYETPLLFLLPAVVLGVYWAFFDFKPLYYILFFSIPFSFNLAIGNIAIDLPSEPITIGLTGITLLYFLGNIRKIDFSFILHPVSLLLLMHLAWAFMTTLTSEHVLFSVKFLLAKIWYIIPFYFLAAKLLSDKKTYKTWLFVTLTAIVLTIIYVMVRHAGLGFTFEDINWVLGPFFPNHVIYAALLTVFIPYVWESLGFFPKWSYRWWGIVGILVLFVIAIKLSYTRAAYISVMALIGVYWLIRWNVLKYFLLLGVFVSFFGVQWILKDNRYLDYAPNFETTIMNTEFDDLVEATYNLEDISVMERVHRWVAAFRMTATHPYMGFGPGNFYSFYKPYTLRMFQTYVSDNPEKSGVHCYFLMVAVEQGIPGMALFTLFMLSIIWTGERAFHLAQDPSIKRRIMANTLSFIAVCLLLIVNDVVENEKIGSFFFLSAAMIVYYHNANLKQLPSNEEQDG